MAYAMAYAFTRSVFPAPGERRRSHTDPLVVPNRTVRRFADEGEQNAGLAPQARGRETPSRRVRSGNSAWMYETMA